MMWTKRVPTKPGYYWYKSAERCPEPTIAEIDTQMRVWVTGNEQEFLIGYYDTLSAEWAGPIAQPKRGR